MATFNKVNAFVNDLADKVHDLATDALKVMLTNTAPVSTSAVKADITEISAGNGYTAGGTQATLTSSSQTGGTYKLVLGNVTFTASGGSIGPFRYAVLYNSTPVAGNIIGWYDYGSNVTLATGESFAVDFDGTNGVLQLA